MSPRPTAAGTIRAPGEAPAYDFSGASDGYNFATGEAAAGALGSSLANQYALRDQALATELSIGAAADSAMASYSPSFDFSGMIDSAASMQFDIAPATAAARGDVAMLNAMQTRGAADNIATLAGYTNGGTPVWDYQDIPEIMVESPNVAAPQQRTYLPGRDPNLMRNSLVDLAKVNAFSAGAGLLGLGGALSALGRGTVQVARNYLTMNPVAAKIASAPELTTATVLAAEAVTPGASGAGALALGTAGVGASIGDDLIREAGILGQSLSRPRGFPGVGGSGPAPGVIGITDDTSVGALRNYYPQSGGVEFCV